MEDKELLETIENYLTGTMSAEERNQFEALRKSSPEIDQMVVDHKLFMDHMQAYANRSSFAKLTSHTFNKLLAAGEWMTDDSISTKTKVIQLWNKYKRESLLLQLLWVVS